MIFTQLLAHVKKSSIFAQNWRIVSMKHLHLENTGPITILDIDLQRYNIFIGPQSSGKSTIAKMISFCTWIEKRALTTLSEDVFSNEQEFIEHVEEYHKMHDYFNEKSVLEYNSQNIHILYRDSKLSIKILDKTSYKRKKILYIPSDRNLVAMPRLDRLVVETNTNLRSFIFDWFDARGAYDKSHRLSILDLNMEYYYDKDAKKVSQDRIIHTNGKTYDIALSDASSGLQSITPLTLLLNYYTNQYFVDYGKTTSYKKDEEKKELEEKISLLFPVIIEDAQNAKGLYNAIERRSLFNKLTTPSSCDFIIEEPEQNLFPSTQAQLISFLLNTCNEQNRAHSFTLTTHSPYILTQLNILLFAGILQKQRKKEQVAQIVSPQMVISPEELSVYAVQEEGTVVSIIDRQSNMISQNYLDSVSEELSIKFQQMYRLLFE